MRAYLFAAALGMVAAPLLAADADRSSAGTLADGSAVEVATLKNNHGMEARVITYGATLQSLIAPDRAGNRAEVNSRLRHRRRI